MSAPDGCPFCHCLDVRLLTAANLDLLGYRCHDCGRTFYVTSDTLLSTEDHAIKAVGSGTRPRGPRSNSN